MNATAFAQEIARLLDDKKAAQLNVLKVDHLTVLCDCLVIATGRSTTNVNALADHVEEELEKQGLSPLRKEGIGGGRWVVLDYGNVIVHIFHAEEREFYNIDRLWDDGTNHIDLPFETESILCPIV